MQLFKSTLQQYESLSDDIRLVVLHPKNKQNQRLFTLHTLNNNAGVYLGLNTVHQDTQAFFDALCSATVEQLNVHLPTIDSKNARAYAEAVAKETGFTLLLDGYDLISSAQVHRFFINLASELNPGQRILVISRHLPNQLLDELPQEQIAILPHHPNRLYVNYRNVEPSTHLLEVRALGPSQAFIDGRPLIHWDGHLPKNLFYYFVDRALTTRGDIFETFWPDLSKQEATNVYHVTKRKISEILGCDLTMFGSGFYRIADNIHLHYDVVTFQEAVQNAEIAENPDDAIQLYEDAISLYQGPYLSTETADWIVERRQELEMVYMDALSHLAELYQARSDIDRTIGLLNRALAVLPLREDIVLRLMQLYRDEGQPGHALEVYTRLAKELEAQLDMAPSSEISELAEDIRRQFDDT